MTWSWTNAGYGAAAGGLLGGPFGAIPGALVGGFTGKRKFKPQAVHSPERQTSFRSYGMPAGQSSDEAGGDEIGAQGAAGDNMYRFDASPNFGMEGGPMGGGAPMMPTPQFGAGPMRGGFQPPPVRQPMGGAPGGGMTPPQFGGGSRGRVPFQPPPMRRPTDNWGTRGGGTSPQGDEWGQHPAHFFQGLYGGRGMSTSAYHPAPNDGSANNVGSTDLGRCNISNDTRRMRAQRAARWGG